MTCESCNIATINGVRAHEHGCPNAWKDVLVACKECDDKFLRENRFQIKCESCLNSAAEVQFEEDSQEENSLGVSESFNAFSEAWILKNVTIEKALAVPGVANLLLEDCHNAILTDYYEEVGFEEDV
jgi:uncharacterized Zn ribbon protein